MQGPTHYYHEHWKFQFVEFHACKQIKCNNQKPTIQILGGIEQTTPVLPRGTVMDLPT